MFASVIIPTHNRRAHVERAVQALMKQDYPQSSYEIIVCCDRCTDGTEQALRSRFGNKISIIRSALLGQPAALNTSWRRAQGELAVLLDDEMEAFEGFITAHVAAHRASGRAKIAVTGYSPVVIDAALATPMTRQLARFFEQYFQELDRPDHESTPLDMCGCNFSIPVAALREAGGFNESYLQRNDFELAVRLLENGYSFRFSRDARASNWIAVDTKTLIDRAAERAREDYRLACAHPWCIRYLQFYRPLHRPGPRRRWRILWETSAAAATILSFFRKLSLNNLHLANLEYLCRYCTGLREQVGSWRKFCELRRIDDQLSRCTAAS